MKAIYNLLACLLATQTFAQNKIYVKVNGDNISAYNYISAALQHANEKDTIFVYPGVYQEPRAILINKRLTILKDPAGGNGTVTIDGSAIAAIADLSTTGNALLLIQNTGNVTIDGLNFQNYIRDQGKCIWILKNDASANRYNNINITNCAFSNIGWIANNLQAKPANNATNVIRVESYDATSISQIHITANTISGCAVGAAEAVTITGNVDTFFVQNNNVHDISNIGIDIHGNSPYVPAPAPVNQARNGVVSGNIVYNCMSAVRQSAGIYLDGAKNITVSGNRVDSCGVGISIGAEETINAGMPLSGGHTINNNVLYGNSIKGVVIGAVPANVDKPVTGVTLYNNTFYKNATAFAVNGITTISDTPLDHLATSSAGEVMLQNVDGLDMKNNIIYPAEGKKALDALDGFKIANFSSDYNDYYRDDNSPFIQISNYIISFNGSKSYAPYYNLPDFTAKTQLEKHSVNQNPRFANAGNFNFSLTLNSKGIVNKGTSTYSSTLSGSVDFAGKPRLFGSTVDIGAYEYQSAVLALSAINPVNVFADGAFVTIAWQYTGDKEDMTFAVERSGDGVNFTTLGNLPYAGKNYTLQDAQPLTGWNYYRVKATGQGSVLYSEVKSINMSGSNVLAVYPNPVINGRFSIVTSGLAASKTAYTLYNMQGIAFAKGILSQPVQPVYLPGLAAGNYILRLAAGQAIKLIIQ